jgi:hypothetical protein
VSGLFFESIQHQAQKTAGCVRLIPRSELSAQYVVAVSENVIAERELRHDSQIPGRAERSASYISLHFFVRAAAELLVRRLLVKVGAIVSPVSFRGNAQYELLGAFAI